MIKPKPNLVWAVWQGGGVETHPFGLLGDELTQVSLQPVQVLDIKNSVLYARIVKKMKTSSEWAALGQLGLIFQKWPFNIFLSLQTEKNQEA